MSKSIQQATKFEEFMLIYEAMIAKKRVWPTCGCKLGQSGPIVMQLKLNMSCHLLNLYTKFQIDISKHVEEKSRKRGRTDRRTDIATAWYVRFSNGRIKIKNGN